MTGMWTIRAVDPSATFGATFNQFVGATPRSRGFLLQCKSLKMAHRVIYCDAIECRLLGGKRKSCFFD
jgi:hypothetical protein